jgi:tRNA-dihydrouridine synthase
MNDKGSKLNPFVMYTEFVNVDGLTHPEGRKKLEIDLKFTPEQRPMVAQIWGTNPDKFYEAAKICAGLGFDGIDINMGCPQDREIGLGACAALIRQPELAKEIIAAVKRGAGDLPVSVKTRIGYSKKEELDDWIKFLLNQNLAVIALHGRTKQEKSKVPANWEAISRAVEIRNQAGSKTLIIGNGDVKSYQEGLDRVAQTKVDGVMVGRGAFGNPWFFRLGGEHPKEVFPLPTSPAAPASPFQSIIAREINSSDNNLSYQPGIKERLTVMLEHARLFNKWLPQKPFVIMRKHFKAYVSGFPGSHELRAELMQAKNLEETENIVNNYLKILA